MKSPREQKMLSVLQKKQKDLVVVMENIHDPHNVFAVLRTCDAIGVLNVHVINTVEVRHEKMGKKSSSSAKKWVQMINHTSVDDCYEQLRSQGFAIMTTRLTENSTDLYELDLTQPLALVFGNEHSGVSDEACQKADLNFMIPQIGMIPSLNVSVACAVSLYEAYRQRQKAGKYDEISLNPKEIEQVFDLWNDKTKFR